MKKLNMGCCGLICKDCPVFVATVNNDDGLRQKTAEEWSKLYADYLGKDLKADDINCKGCWSEHTVFTGCLSCPIRSCCKEKKFTTCASCDEYEVCNMLNGFYSVFSHQHAKSNLDKIRAKHG